MGNRALVEDAPDSEVIRCFVGESINGLETASEKLVLVEKGETGEIDELLRIFHSVKGSGSCLGFFEIKKIAHLLESVVIAIRDGKRAPSASSMNRLFRGIDCLALLVGNLLQHPSDRKPGPEFLLAVEALEAELVTLKDGGRTAVRLSELKEAVADVCIARNQNERLDPVSTKQMRIDEKTIDSFMNHTGELISASETFRYLRHKLDSEPVRDDLRQEFRDAIDSFYDLSQELQNSLMEVRRLPLKSLFTKYPRLIRDLCGSLSKEVDLKTEGDVLKVDKSLIEQLDSPMIHILRNCMDHGIEPPGERVAAGKPRTGVIRVRAWQDEVYTYLSVRDDGRGIVREKVLEKAIHMGLISEKQSGSLSLKQIHELIFMPGFSTAEKVTDVSGRGVGMDVVSTNVRKANGTIEVDSQPGKGTQITVRIPLNAQGAVTECLIAEISGNHGVCPLLFPVDSIESILHSAQQDIVDSPSVGNVVYFKGQYLRIVRLRTLFGWSAAGSHPAAAETLLCIRPDASRDPIAVAVDAVIGIQQVMIKKPDSLLKGHQLVQGNGILRDGRIGLALNSKTLMC